MRICHKASTVSQRSFWFVISEVQPDQHNIGIDLPAHADRMGVGTTGEHG